MIEALDRQDVTREELEAALKDLVRQPAWSLVAHCLELHCEELRDRLATGRFDDLCEVTRIQGKLDVLGNLLLVPEKYLAMLMP